MIVELGKSKNKGKRYYVKMDDGRIFHFGLLGGKTYADGESETTKKNYWARHMANPLEKKLLAELIPSSSVLAAHILWGESRDIYKNVYNLNKLWKAKHIFK